jgi:hypothetical protein
LVELWRLLAAHRRAIRQARCVDRLRALVLGQVCSGARRTRTQVLLTLGLIAADWSAFYRLFSHARLDYDVLTRCFVQQTLAQIPPQEPYVAVVDGVQLPRSSQRMPGTSWLKSPRTPPFKPGMHRAQHFVHLAALLPRWQGYSPAVPVCGVPAFPHKAVRPRCRHRKKCSGGAGSSASTSARWPWPSRRRNSAIVQAHCAASGPSCRSCLWLAQ